MANSIQKIGVLSPEVTGGILIADSIVDNANLPVDTSTAVDAAFKARGFVGESGVERTVQRSTEKLKAWGGNTVRILQTSHDVLLKFTLLQIFDPEVLNLVRGNNNVNVDGTSGLITAKITGDPSAPRSACFVMKDGDHAFRSVAPVMQLSDEGPEQWQHGGASVKELTFEALDRGDGVKMIDLMLPAA